MFKALHCAQTITGYGLGLLHEHEDRVFLERRNGAQLIPHVNFLMELDLQSWPELLWSSYRLSVAVALGLICYVLLDYEGRTAGT